MKFEASVARLFPTFSKFIVHREANLNNFWQPQFGPNGEDVAARSYERLLASSCDALKAVSPRIEVYGGGLSQRGHDPTNSSLSHSPVRFIRDVGEAYRRSGRRRPIADGWAHHPYQCSRTESPYRTHRGTSISIADYPKLVRTLRRAFTGTNQRWKMPIIYDEYGIESSIPREKLRAYTHPEWVGAGELPSPERQGTMLTDAIRIASRQKLVRGMFLFHLIDNPEMGGWQSGLYYADGSEKPALRMVRSVAEAGGVR